MNSNPTPKRGVLRPLAAGAVCGILALAGPPILGGCEDDGAAEEVGEDIDDAADDVEDAVDDIGDDID